MNKTFIYLNIKFILASCFLLLTSLSFAQFKDTTNTSDPKIGSIYYYDNYEYNTKRAKRLIGITGGLYAGSMIGLNQLWYANYPRGPFHWHNDNRQWMQVDKVGHAFSAYGESIWFLRACEWTGIEHRKAVWLGGGFGFFAQTVIEILDGYSVEWGASAGDLLANTAGSALVVGQELLWREQRLSLKWSFHSPSYPSGQLENRAKELYGQSFFQTFMKDYNGQTHWLSGSIQSFIPKSNLPSWLCLSVGYGAEQMYGGEDNTWDSNGDGIRNIDRTDIPRLRQYYLSLDVDLTRIKTNNEVLKKFLIAFNVVKFPMPTLEFTDNGTWKFYPVYF